MANINKLLICTFLSFFNTCLKLNLLRTALGLDGELDTLDTLDDHGRDRLSGHLTIRADTAAAALSFQNFSFSPK